jgi:hypothetical protein
VTGLCPVLKEKLFSLHLLRRERAQGKPAKVREIKNALSEIV